MGNKNVLTNIYRKQAYNSIMCGYFCIGLNDRKQMFAWSYKFIFS